MTDENTYAEDSADQVAASTETQTEQPAEASTESADDQAMTAAEAEEEAEEYTEPGSFMSQEDIRKNTLALAGQIFCAKSGEIIGNRSYDWTDAYFDAAGIVTIAVTEAKSKELFQLAAERLGLQSPLE